MCAVAVVFCRDAFCGNNGAFVCLRNVFFLRARHEHMACDGIANIDIRANDLLHAVRKAQHAGIYRKRRVENFGKLLGNVVAACDGRMGHHADFLIRRVHFLCGDGVKVAAFFGAAHGGDKLQIGTRQNDAANVFFRNIDAV